jgi:hypothetical protein
MNKYEIANTSAAINTMLDGVDSLIRRNLDTYYTNGSSEVSPHIGLNVNDDGSWDVTYYEFGRTAFMYSDDIQVEVGFDLCDAVEDEHEALRAAAEKAGMTDTSDIDNVLDYLEEKGIDADAIRKEADELALEASIDAGLIEHHKDSIIHAVEKFMGRKVGEAA